MKKYNSKRQTAPIINALEREIQITKLAGSIIEARYAQGKLKFRLAKAN